MSKILIIAEHDGQALNLSTAKSVSCGQAIGGEIDVLVMGSAVAEVAKQAAALDSVNRVISVDAAHLAVPLAANLAAETLTAAAGYSHILAPSTTFGKDVMPRVAALLGVGQVSDIMAVDGPRSFKRPVYAGNAILTVDVAEGSKIVATVRTASWQ
jgi:electron transfer flavoprotein alpha subunit